LIGLPLRLVVSKRTLAGGAVEWKLRTAQESQMVALADVVEQTRAFIAAAQTALT
jgi:hypothetical protein